MPFYKFFLTSSLIFIVLTLNGCGKKGPLYIPTDEQRAQMEKEQAERDAVLEKRKQEQ
jgi:predicted small lipoprotein YifL